MANDIPDDVRAFIGQSIHSVAHLEVLLALRQEPDRLWSAEEITNRLYLERQMVMGMLADLVRQRFVVQEDVNFRYKPANDTVGGLIERLAQLYQDRRVAVTIEIFAKPPDAASAFAEAFRLRGKE
jgi:hypothetical protein